MTMRSTDLFLGLPFNLTSTAILTHIIAKVLHLKTYEIAIAITDGHIYEEHIKGAELYLDNTYRLPQLKDEIYHRYKGEGLWDFEPLLLEITDYEPLEPIKFKLKG